MTGTVTINGQIQPAVWVEAHKAGGTPWGAHATTMPSGTWEWKKLLAGIYDVVITAPPGLACDVTRKTVTVEQDQRTVVDFACYGEFKSSIAGFIANEFGPMRSGRVTLKGVVDREAVADGNGLFTFDGLPTGQYIVGPCNPVAVSVREGTTALAKVDCS